jgi:hypothetical protein
MIARIPSHALDDSVATANRFDPQPTTELTDFQKKLDFDRIYVKGSPSPRPFPIVKDSIRILSWNIARGHQPARIASALCATVAPFPHISDTRPLIKNDRSAGAGALGHGQAPEWAFQRMMSGSGEYYG